MVKYATIFLSVVSLSAQSVVSVDTFTRVMPIVGVNTNAHHTIANWKIPAFVESTAVLKPSLLRFPGGTVANHWDWKRGWFQNAPTTPPELANINPKDTIRIEEFKPALEQLNAKGLFVLNFQHSTIEVELEGLLHTESLGVPVEFVELGNEHNLSISNQFIDPSVYAAGTKVWGDSIKKYFPQSKLCLVGGSPPNQPGWNDSIIAANGPFDALAFHVYLGSGSVDSTFHVKRALSVPFTQLQQRFVQSKFSLLPPEKEVWVTEFNLSENLAGQPNLHGETWAHTLYVLSMMHIFLENPRITMIVNHNLTNQLEFAAISPFDHHITANGVAIQLFGEVSQGMTSADRLAFPQVPSQDYAGAVFPRVIGWRFSDGKRTSVIIVNLSDSAMTFDGSSLFTSGITATSYFAEAEVKINGKQSLSMQLGNSAAAIASPQYSVTCIDQVDSPTSAFQTEKIPSGFQLIQNYPNPFNPSTTIGFTLQTSGLTTLKVYDAIGREVAVLVNEHREAGVFHQSVFNASSLSSGIYFAKLVTDGRSQVRKLSLIK